MRITPFICLVSFFTAFDSSTATQDDKVRHLRGGTTDGEDKDIEVKDSILPKEITVKNVEAFYVGPALDPPSTKIAVPKVPRELSDDPEDPEFEFLGHLSNLTEDQVSQRDAKIKEVNDYLDSLKEEDREYLENQVDLLVRKKKGKGGRKNKFKEVAIAITDDDHVWSYRPTKADLEQNSTAYEPVEGVSDEEVEDSDDDTTDKTTRHGSTPLLKSKYNGNNMRAYPWRAQGCVSKSGTGPSSCCSGTKISARLVITAGHCLSKNGSWNNRRWWIPGADGVAEQMMSTSISPNGVRGTSVRWTAPNWLHYNWYSADLGLLVLHPTKENCNLGWFGYGTGPLLGRTVKTYGYPAGKCADSPVTGGYCKNSIYGNSAKVYAAGYSGFRYHFDRQEGMSGSGVYRGNYKVVGVHTHGVGLGNKHGRACRINKSKYNWINKIRDKYPDSSAGC